MKPWKRLIERAWFRRFLSWLGAQYLRLVYASGRWTDEGFDVLEKHWRDGTPLIACFWHARMLMMLFCWRSRQSFWMLTSRHRDGQLIADVTTHFDIREIKGSSSRGGADAVRSMLSVLRRGDSVGVTPDGPRGPRLRANLGAIKIAQMSGAPIVPVSYAVSRCTTLSTWDRFIIPWPFSRGILICGPEIVVPRHAGETELEQARARLERALNDITAEADRRIAGAAPQAAGPPTPAPPS